MSQARSKARSKAGDKSRAITDDEADLWKYATRDADPIRAKPRVGATSDADPAAELDPAPRKQPPPPPPAPKKAKPQPPPTMTSPKSPGAARKSSPAPLADFDRRKARQVSAGSVAIDARIDLHGLRRRDARSALRAFLMGAHANGHRVVLVITGKGSDQPVDRLGPLLGEPQRGVLKQEVPNWLAEPDLRAIVLSHTAAGPRHGGSGALYVQLRKKG